MGHLYEGSWIQIKTLSEPVKDLPHCGLCLPVYLVTPYLSTWYYLFFKQYICFWS